VPSGRRDAVGGYVQPGDRARRADVPSADDGGGLDRASRAVTVKHHVPAAGGQPYRDQPIRDWPLRDQHRRDQARRDWPLRDQLFCDQPRQPLGEPLSLVDPAEPFGPLLWLGLTWEPRVNPRRHDRYDFLPSDGS